MKQPPSHLEQATLHKLNAIVLWILGLGMAAGGLSALIGMLSGETPTWSGTDPWIRGGTVAAVILGFLFVSVFGPYHWRKGREFLTLEEKSPTHGTPWLKRADWAENRIPSMLNEEVRQYKVGALFFIAALCLFCAIGIFGRHDSSLFGRVLLAIVIIGSLGSFIYSAWTWRNKWKESQRFGSALFVMASVPARPGTNLEGTIKIPPVPMTEVSLTLTCSERSSGGDDGGYVTRILWEEKTRSQSILNNNGLEAAISVMMPIRSEAWSTEVLPGRPTGIFYTLTAKADLPDVPLYAKFEIPIFGMNLRAPGYRRFFAWMRRRVGFVVKLAFLYLIVRMMLPYAAAIVPASWESAISRYVVPDNVKRLPEDKDMAVLGKQILSAQEKQPFHIRFLISDSSEVNATAWIGGIVVVNKGLIADLRSADEIAAVLAHELEHIHHRHALQQWLHQFETVVLLHMIWSSTPQKWSERAEHIVESQYSRSQERQADDDGMRLLVHAGLACDGMVSIFERWSKRNKGDPRYDRLLATHPTDLERLENARGVLLTLEKGEAKPNINWDAFRHKIGVGKGEPQ